MSNLIAFVGFKSCGKDTAANYLTESMGFKAFAFADPIKDCLASIFVWDRALLNGDTVESREWREKVDPWWAAKLGIPNFSPRWAMTHFGTDLMRNHFDDRIWILSTDRRLEMFEGEDIAIKDGRFPNELAAVRARGGMIVRIKRGDDPWWFDTAAAANAGCAQSLAIMKSMDDVHESEWAWIGQDFDAILSNDDTIAALHDKVASFVSGVYA